ncbi:unnamed protein product [Medioppia subpectinata]|uniref:Solute carrier family 43 member 3 n=1 Tax=Medioppia subpectinata TaxID=1979941 RepID=A0A7R9KQN0_9ACAR|nr:unnamed protein product [Medioppia subpectinata]CAG2106746.1 unnamed protein product [Medioppia subpectinata]
MSISSHKKVLILLCGLIENLIFSGTLFGWPALFYMLKSEGIYEHLCHTIESQHYTSAQNNNLFENLTLSQDLINEIDSNATEVKKFSHFPDLPVINATIYNDIQITQDCSAQENILNLTYTIGIFAMGFTSFIWGFLLESWGLRIVRILLNILITGGSVLLCLTSRERSYLIFPAIILLALAGVPLRIANMQIADYFPSKRSTVITFFSGAFSASPIVFVVLKYIYDSGVFSFLTVILVLVILSLFMFPFTYFLLPAISVKHDDHIKNNIELQTIEKDSLGKLAKETNGKTLNGFNGKSYDNNGNGMKGDGEDEVFIKPDSKRVPIVMDSNDSVPLNVSLWSLAFMLHQLWFSWLNTYMVLYSGSMNLWLDRVTSDTVIAGDFTETFGMVQVSALIIAPIAGLFMDRNINRANKGTDPFENKLSRAQSGFLPILVTTIVLTISVVCRFFNTVGAVYSSIVFITLLRSFLVAVASAYLRIR